MAQASRPYRSVLYIPADKPRAIEKARSLKCDAIIFDLEDAVAPDAKEDARVTLREELAKGGFGKRFKIVRINGFDTVWGRQDLLSLKQAGVEIDALLLPKVSSAWDIEAANQLCDILPFWVMMETPQAFLNACEIGSHPRVEGMVMGTNDLIKELGCRPGADRMELMTSLQTCLLAARAAGIAAIDGVYNAFKDIEGLSAEALQGRNLGFDGKTLIHPAQIEVVNEIFAPGEDELELARRQIAAWEEAQAQGKGIAVLDGRIVENLHVATARALIDRAQAIAELEAGE